MNAGEGPTITDFGPGARDVLEPILDESFEGWYLRHSKKTLHEIGKVRVAELDGRPTGLAMLKSLGDGVGYIYYVAVAKSYRRRGVGGKLVEDAVAHFASLGAKMVYASVENEDAENLFTSRGFKRTDFSAVSKRYGLLRAVSMYRSMLSVPGEVLLETEISDPRQTKLSSGV